MGMSCPRYLIADSNIQTTGFNAYPLFHINNAFVVLRYAGEPNLFYLLSTTQTCVTPNRFLVHSSIAAEFLSRLTKTMAEQLKLGDGMTKGVNQGPLVNKRQHDRVRP